MKRLILVLSIAMFVMSMRGEGIKSHYSLKLSDFDELKVVDGINVDYICDASRAGEVEFEATKEVASAVIFEPSKSKLSIKLACRETPYEGLPTIKVYSRYLTNISNEGDSLVRVISVAPAAKFSCRVMGNGSMSVRNVEATNVQASILSGHGIISIYGSCTEATLKITGSGTIQADELKADKVSCTSTGTGTISCFPGQVLSIGGLGGTVQYRGKPEIKKRFISGVKLKPLD